jgi:hypothetical protein
MDNMTLAWIAVAAVALIVVVAIFAVTMSNRRREKHLQDTFGTEYDQTYASAVDRKAARQDLKAREKRVSSYELRELEPEQRRMFVTEWQSMQATFVDDPIRAVSRADNLLSEVMRARGYETDLSDPDARIEDVSVGHGDEARAFRDANRVAALNRVGRATTEDLRRAIKDYGTVFDSLLNERQAVR